jgi:lysophospholipase L1-like esterase
VHYVDLVSQFGGGDGSYSDTVTLPDGTIVNARDRDGVHLSHDGANLLAPILWQTFAPEWHLTG